MIKHLLFLNICKNFCFIFVKIFSVKVCNMCVTKNQVLVFLTLTLIKYKFLDLIYLNVMLKLVRKKFIKTMLFCLYAADLLEFNEECSIIATDQA